MPVRSLHSSVLKWPDRDTVFSALRRWLPEQRKLHPEVRSFGVFGSYARGDWGVGSDLDLVAIVDAADAPFGQRALSWDVLALPVPADLLIYTSDEWNRMGAEDRGFARKLRGETVWLLSSEERSA